MIRPISVEEILASYDDKAPLSEASTIPAPWYVDPRIAELENLTVFSKTWQVIGRADQVEKPGPVCDCNGSGRADCSRAWLRRRIARFLQRLPSPRGESRDRTLRQRVHPALPVSRMELRSRRLAERNAGV